MGISVCIFLFMSEVKYLFVMFKSNLHHLFCKLFDYLAWISFSWPFSYLFVETLYISRTLDICSANWQVHPLMNLGRHRNCYTFRDLLRSRFYGISVFPSTTQFICWGWSQPLLVYLQRCMPWFSNTGCPAVSLGIFNLVSA